jgi:hypothetical protein
MQTLTTNTTKKPNKVVKTSKTTKAKKDDKIVILNLRVPLSLRREIKLLAIKKDISMVQCLTQAFKEYKKRKG